MVDSVIARSLYEYMRAGSVGSVLNGRRMQVLIYFAAHRAVSRPKTGQMRCIDALTAQCMNSIYLVLHSGRLGKALRWSFYVDERIDSAHTKCILSFS